VNGNTLLVPFAVVTVTSRGPGAADASTVIWVLSDVLFETLGVPAVTPDPLIAMDVPPAMNPVPVKVTAVIVPGAAADGFKVVSVGDPAGSSTVNVTGLLVPVGVVTVMERGPIGAAESMVSIVVSEVLEVTLTVPAVTPVPLTLTAVAPATK
jgi:hypothetical protein